MILFYYLHRFLKQTWNTFPTLDLISQLQIYFVIVCQPNSNQIRDIEEIYKGRHNYIQQICKRNHNMERANIQFGID